MTEVLSATKKTPNQSVISGRKYRVKMLKLLSKFLSPGTLSVRRNESLFRQCRLFSQTTTEPPIKSSEAVPPANTLETTEAEDDKLYKRLELELRGVDPAVLNSFTTFAITAAKHLNIEVGRCWAPLKAEKERYTLLKSAFVHKKHRVQYEIRTYFKFLNLHKLTGSTLSTYLEYIERNLPEGVALKTTKIEILALDEYLRQPPPKDE